MEYDAKYDKKVKKWYPVVDGHVYDDIGFCEPVTAHHVAGLIKGELNANKKTID